MKAFINLRGAINSVRSEVRTKLPKCLSDIDIEKKTPNLILLQLKSNHFCDMTIKIIIQKSGNFLKS